MVIYLTAFMPVTLEARVVQLPAVPPVGSYLNLLVPVPDRQLVERVEYRVSKVSFSPQEVRNEQVSIWLELP